MDQTTRSRPFAWDDIPRLHELLSRRWAVDGPRAQMHIGDFYWALRPSPIDDPLHDARLWPDDGGSLLAFAWLDAPGAGDVIAAPEAPASTLDETVGWLEAEQRRTGGSSLSIVVLDGDVARADVLRWHGYTRGAGGNVRFWRRLDSTPASTILPDAFTLRNVCIEEDIERRVFVESNSFDYNITADAWRVLMRRLPTYRPELDLIAVAPDGTGASACTCWYDAATRCGEFEAVGTSKAFQRMGVGRAVITEGLRRLHALGATQAVVQTLISNGPAITLYRSCGFEAVAEDHSWSKRL